MKSKIYKIILIIVVLSSNIFADLEKELFQQAIDFYKNADYYSAEQKLLELNSILNQKGEISSEILYNLGNCYFRQNKLGLARYYFELSKIVSPYNKDIEYNLRYIKSILNIGTEEGIFEYLLSFIHLKHLLLLTFIFNVLFFGSLIATNFVNLNIINWLKRIGFILFVIFGILSIAKYNYLNKPKCIIVETTQIFSAPEENINTKSVTVNEGKKAIILSKKDNFYAIYLVEDKVQGWIKADKIKILTLRNI